MKPHDKDAIDHSFGVGSGIRTLHSRPIGHTLARHGAPSNEKPPRPWHEMLDAWGWLLGTLCAVLLPAEITGPARAEEQGMVNARRIAEASEPEALHLRVWRWMWSLPPCSMARKAAFTLGHAALLIERWRVSGAERATDERVRHERSEHMTTDPLAEAFAARLDQHIAIGQRAEVLLRILAWQIDDARGERQGQALHGAPAPSIPPHERVYRRTPVLTGATGATYEDLLVGDAIHHLEDGGSLARAILRDHLISGPPVPLSMQRMRTELPRIEKAFAETAIASLPDGPWVMTSTDVSRFLDMILEESDRSQIRPPDPALVAELESFEHRSRR